MKRYLLSPVPWFVLALAMATSTFALWGRYPNDKEVKADNWPQPIVKAINAHRRVYGAGSGDSGWSFYFLGKTDDVNRFLEQVAEEKIALLKVVLMPEPGTANVMSESFEKDLKIDFSWSLHLYPYRDGMWIDAKAGESDEQFQKRRKQELAKLPEFAATVTVYCSGPIDPAGLKLPLRFNASVGGPLANLVHTHNQRRDQLEKDGKPITGESPTDMSATKGGGGLFGASTKPVDGSGK